MITMPIPGRLRLAATLLPAVVLLAGCGKPGAAPAAFEPYHADELLQQIYELNTEQVASLLKRSPDVVVVDIRDVEAYSGSRLPNAYSFDFHFAGFRDEIGGISRDVPVLVYGTNENDAGIDTAHAVGAFEELGFSTIYFYTEGIETWKDAGHAFESDS